jgi:hypothetical protein
LEFQIEHEPRRRVDIQPELVMFGENKVIGTTRWTDSEGADIERYQVLTLRDGKIVDIQGCRSRHEAERFARRS